jgi:hypothetical protein
MRQTIAAMNDLDQAVTTVGGIALRYGSFYGDPIDPLVTAVRARKWPIVGDGGVWSYIHLEDAATSWLSRPPLVVAAKVIVATTVSSSSARSSQRPRLA